MACRCRLQTTPEDAPAERATMPSPAAAPIKIVYYAYLVNDWQALVSQQLQQLFESGLVAHAAEVHLISSGSAEACAQFAALALPAPAHVLVSHQINNEYELPGISRVHAIAQQGPARILYFHTKGVSNNVTDFASRQPSALKLRGAAAWRRFMAHFLIDRWQDALNALETNDVVAAYISPENNWPYGNFWWTTSAHARTCETPAHADRWYYEAWLTTKGRPGRYHSCTRNEFDFHTSDHPAWLYDGSPIARADLNILEASYGSPATQVDEGRPLPPDQPIRADVTAALRDLVRDGRRMDFRVDNQLFGDPCHGIKKELAVRWTLGDSPDSYRLFAAEGARVYLELPDSKTLPGGAA